MRFIEKEVIDKEKEISLYEQLAPHLVELNTYKEADLCDSSIVQEQVFIATVHKAKGLEYENVIVYGCVNGIYPFFANDWDKEAKKEDARKLYVAISRAMKRLCLLEFLYREGNTYFHSSELSDFLKPTVDKFDFLLTTDKDFEPAAQ